MKVPDKLGNEIKAGDVVAWMPMAPACFFASVQKCIEPGANQAEQGDDAPGKVVFTVELTINPAKGSVDPFFLSEVIKTHDPRQESVLLGGSVKGPVC